MSECEANALLAAFVPNFGLTFEFERTSRWTVELRPMIDGEKCTIAIRTVQEFALFVEAYQSGYREGYSSR